jgi:hypothetical protein
MRHAGAKGRAVWPPRAARSAVCAGAVRLRAGGRDGPAASMVSGRRGWARGGRAAAARRV